ncbi:hypothetical protein MHYP_G00305040 [Metynnis hypsauchen]
MPSTLPSFQTQLASIMETLAKTAILEISKLVDMECKILRSEVARSHHEIDSLRKRLQLMEHMLVQEGVQNQQQVGNGSGGEAAVLLTSVQEHCLVQLPHRTDSQPRVKREGNLDESNRCDSALGESSGEPKKDQTNLEKQSDCVWQHHEEKQPSELPIKQEPDGMDIWNCETGGQNLREKTPCVTGSTSAEEISSTIGHLTGDTAGRGIQTVKTTSSADPLDRISLEDNSCDQEGPTLQVQASTGIRITDYTTSQSFLLPRSIRTLTTSSFSGEKRFADGTGVDILHAVFVSFSPGFGLEVP